MSYSGTTALFEGGVEGINVPGVIASAPLVGVGTSYVAGTTPVLNGGINVCAATAGNTAFALPGNWPLSAPIIVTANSGSTAAIVCCPTGGTLNGVTTGTLSVTAGKSAIFYCVGQVAGLPIWVYVMSA